MRRPCSFHCRQTVLSLILTLAASGCGKGLYTRSGKFHNPDGGTGGDRGGETSATGGVSVGGSTHGGGGSGGGVGGGLNSGAEVGGGAGTGGDRGGARDGGGEADAGQSGLSVDTRVLPDASPSRTPDLAPKYDVDPGTGITKNVSGDFTTVIQFGDATLTFPKGSFPSAGPYPVTLSLVRSEALPPGYGGALSGIYSISTSVSLWNTASLKIRITPDPALSPQRLGMAYVDFEAKSWILIVNPDSYYDPATSEVIGDVVNFAGRRYFAVVETCAKDGYDASVCHFFPSCKAQACQE